jgi:hypothetical protein
MLIRGLSKQRWRTQKNTTYHNNIMVVNKIMYDLSNQLNNLEQAMVEN